MYFVFLRQTWHFFFIDRSRPVLRCVFFSLSVVFLIDPQAQAGRPGYCELCTFSYRDLAEHLASAMHRSKAEDDSNFELIDAVPLFHAQKLREQVRRKRAPMSVVVVVVVVVQSALIGGLNRFLSCL